MGDNEANGGAVRFRLWQDAGKMRKIIIAGTAVVTAVAAIGTTLVVSAMSADAATTAGIDISHHQGNVNWTSVKKAGAQFAYIKATEGIKFVDNKFKTNYANAAKAKVIRGPYHFALPDRSTGAAQADFLIKNAGRWSANGLTLPAAIDLEYNPYGSSCYGLSTSKMRSWISSFLNRYKSRTGRYAVIYTSTSWWKTCTGNYSGFASKHPLWVARYSSKVGTLPSGWKFHTFWQYTASGKVSGVSGKVDRNSFNGSRTRLLALANNKA